MTKAQMASVAILAIALTPATAEPLLGGCGDMQALAQEHANDMARRDRLDHAGFKSRAARMSGLPDIRQRSCASRPWPTCVGARAENVAFGHASEAATLAHPISGLPEIGFEDRKSGRPDLRWRASSRHAANMRRGGCQAIASAQSRSGRVYWVMEIGR